MSRRVYPLVFGVVVVVACSRFGSDDPTPAPAGVDAGPDSATSPTLDGSTGTDATAPVEAGTVGPCPGLEPGQFCEASCNDSLCLSCATLLTAYPGAPNGYYRIAKRGGGDIDVYCDMVTAGGGWILAGRSVAGTAGDFGWGRDSGDVMSDDDKYSLNTHKLTFLPTETLFGARANGKAWGNNVYTVDLNAFANFWNGTDAFATAGHLNKVIGTCDGGVFQQFIGYTADTQLFFFRDNTDNYDNNEGLGLTPHGWFTVNPGACEQTGLIGGEQGMIFVR